MHYFSSFRYLLNKKIFSKLNSGYALPPSIIFLALNTRCNLKCIMCDSAQNVLKSSFVKNTGTNKENIEIPYELVKKLVDEIKVFKPIISITSREPLLHKNILDIIFYILKNNLKCSLTTNGFLLSDFAADLVRMKLHYLYVSIDGPSSIHDEIRGVKGAFRRAINGIQKIQYLKRMYNLNFPRIGIYYTINHKNFIYLEQTRRYFEALKVNDIHFDHINFITSDMAEIHNQKFTNLPVCQSGIYGRELEEVDVKKLWKQLRMVENNKREIKVFTKKLSLNDLEIYYREPKKFIRKTNRCLSPWLYAQVTARGELVPMLRCYHLVFGNINDHSFKEIWNVNSFKEYRKRLKKYRFFPACSRCLETL